ncbi:hypothetical protein SAMN05877753_11344 [Bacillus oleivorans]|uniref:Uncharacterized protein n=1 Tax=Bacillus oleivorans TaxID=1448271 RepID=A0A285D6T9_9BACI|nr:hypothetical protein [Bacillus oleivorans]SNX75544.1 hypothetical protein SAMN05877753_11344 [Bacillus oleivorans]
MENMKINEKILQRLESYDEEVQEIIKKGISYTERAQLTRVKNRLSRDIEKMAKESM